MSSSRSETREGSLYLESVALRVSGEVHEAVVMDYSTHGLQVSLLMPLPVEVGDQVTVDIFDGESIAVWPMSVRWTRPAATGDGCRLGLHSTRPLPVRLGRSPSLGGSLYGP